MERYRFSDTEQRILENYPQPLAVYQFVNGHVVTLSLSEGFLELFEYTDKEVAYLDMDNDMYKYTHPDDVSRIAEAAVRFATEEEKYDVIYRTLDHKSGGYRIVHATGRHIYTDDGVRLAYVWYTDEGLYVENADNTKTIFSRSLNNALHEESLMKENYYDYLTGLPSMTYFFELAGEAKRKAHAKGDELVFLFINLSGMKFFNNKYGFAEGDSLLREFAKLLSDIFSSENCCHLGQDHFGVYTVKNGVEDRLKQLFNEAAELYAEDSLPVRVGIFSSWGEDYSASAACDRAKVACDTLRGTFESAYNYYNEELKNELAQKKYILENFDKALENRWIQVYYQPIIRAVNGRVCDEEALARWIDPEVGLLPPAKFIPFLEETHLIYKLDLYILERVLEKMNHHKSIGLIMVPHSINLSRSDFDSCDIVEEVRKRVDDADIPHNMVTIEVTESTVADDFDFMREQINRFKALGFPVWLDDFGSGYSSLDSLKSIEFDLLKFDMSFMQRLDEGERGKIILSELMRLANSLGIDTVCEGVETADQANFLREIGCSKLQGYHYCKPIPLDKIIERYDEGTAIGFENPVESDYYETLGRINLYDFGGIAKEGDAGFDNFFDSIPMGVIEVRAKDTRFVRSNKSYRDFVKRFLGFDLSREGTDFVPYSDSFMNNVVKTCCYDDQRSFYDEEMPNGSIVHSFARRIGYDPVSDTYAIAVAVLSITDPNEGATYSDIARALAADYYNIYYVDLDTEEYIEYSSQVGEDELAFERHGENFFDSARKETMIRIYEDDREKFLSFFNKETIENELDAQGLFTATYRLIDTGKPIYVNMKITRMHRGSSKIIMGISIIDSQMKQQILLEELQKDHATLARVMALTEDYITVYIVDVESGQYVEYAASDDFERLGLEKAGSDFFADGIANGKITVHPDDLPAYLEFFNRETILSETKKSGVFKAQYRLVIEGRTVNVSLKVAPYMEGNKEKLFAGVRAWRDRK